MKGVVEPATRPVFQQEGREPLLLQPLGHHPPLSFRIEPEIAATRADDHRRNRLGSHRTVRKERRHHDIGGLDGRPVPDTDFLGKDRKAQTKEEKKQEDSFHRQGWRVRSAATRSQSGAAWT